MAQRRMISLKVIDTDIFLDMPLSTQALYFHLIARADDDGFIANHNKIMRMIGSSKDDMKILLSKRFIIPFESGVCVIKHWKIHNLIRADRYSETIYKEEKSRLKEDQNKAYIPDVIPDVIPDGNQMEPQVRLGKVSIGKVSKGNINKPKKEKGEFAVVDKVIDYFNQVTNQKRQYSKTSRQPIKARLRDGFTVEQMHEVIDKKYKDWKNDPYMSKNITIETLFRASNFEKYVNQVEFIPTTAKDYNEDAVIGSF